MIKAKISFEDIVTESIRRCGVDGCSGLLIVCEDGDSSFLNILDEFSRRGGWKFPRVILPKEDYVSFVKGGIYQGIRYHVVNLPEIEITPQSTP